jgi:hypothetical protein
MIKLFRKTRKEMLSGNPSSETGWPANFTKYLLYAIGEIVLVFIGILLALQFNNWNEERKDNISVEKYLQGISQDLSKDIIGIDNIIKEQSNDINIINSIEPTFNVNPLSQPGGSNLLSVNPDTSFSMFRRIFYSNLSFRPARATYNSMISDGKTNLIKDKVILEAIQNIYDVSQQRIASIYESINERENDIVWTYPYEKMNWTYKDLNEAKDEVIFMRLANFTEMKYFYCLFLSNLRKEILDVNMLIKLELGE